jgi:DNA topoisomerase IB
VSPEEVNAYIKYALGERFSAKNFRTWHGTVIAAAALAARIGPEWHRSATARRQAMRAVAGGVAETLGDTPGVARASYIDPRVFDRFQSGWVIDVPPLPPGQRLSDRRHRELELAVLELMVGSDRAGWPSSDGSCR